MTPLQKSTKAMRYIDLWNKYDVAIGPNGTGLELADCRITTGFLLKICSYDRRAAMRFAYELFASSRIQEIAQYWSQVIKLLEEIL